MREKIKKKKKSWRREGTVLPLYIPLLYYSLRRLCADEFTVKKIVCRFSFLTVSLYGTREKKIKSSCQAFVKVLFSNSFSILYIENN